MPLPLPLPDFEMIERLLALAALGMLCGVAALVLGLYFARVRAGQCLAAAAIVAGVAATALGLLRLLGDVGPSFHFVTATPVLPGFATLALLHGRRRRRRGFPVPPRDDRPAP